MHIAIDGTPAINDIRAIKRYTWNLIEQIAGVSENTADNYSVIFLGTKSDTKLPESSNPNVRLKKSSISGKILNLFWKYVNYPDAQFFTRAKFDLFHFPGGHTYLPVKNAKIISTMHGFSHQVIPEFMDEKVVSQTIKNSKKLLAKQIILLPYQRQISTN